MPDFISTIAGCACFGGLLLAAGLSAAGLIAYQWVKRSGRQHGPLVKSLAQLGQQLAPLLRPPQVYIGRQYLMTRGEAAFFRVLQQAVGGKYQIMAKVRLTDLMDVRGKGSDRSRAWNRICQKHADFVLLDVRDLRIRLVIELDDRSHTLERRRERDAFWDKTMSEAGLAILRVRAAANYNADDLTRKIANAVTDVASSAT